MSECKHCGVNTDVFYHSPTCPNASAPPAGSTAEEIQFKHSDEKDAAWFEGYGAALGWVLRVLPETKEVIDDE